MFSWAKLPARSCPAARVAKALASAETLSVEVTGAFIGPSNPGKGARSDLCDGAGKIGGKSCRGTSKSTK
jgi:hypothetical protein